MGSKKNFVIVKFLVVEHMRLISGPLDGQIAEEVVFLANNKK